MADLTFTLYIKQTDGKSFQHPYHLGTQEPTARRLAEEIFRNHSLYIFPTETVKLIRGGQVFDVWNGKGWESGIH